MPINLLYIIPNIDVAGGISRIVIDKVNYLSKTGEFKLFICYYGDGKEKSVYPIDKNVRLFAIRTNGDKSIIGRIRKVVNATNSVRKIINDNDIDIAINANAQYLLWTLPFICRKVKKVHEFHFSFQGQFILDRQTFKNPIIRITIRKIRNYCVGKFDKAIVLTDSDKDSWHLKNIDVIPNFTTIASDEVYSASSKIALSIGRLEHQKDFQLMVKAWNIVHQAHSDWQLNIFGDGSMKEEIETLIRKMKLNDSVFLKGNTNDVIREYSESSLFLSSSRYEGLPLVLIEAQRCGIPCVGFDITGVRDVIKDNETGVLVRKRTAESLASGICTLIENPILRKSMHEKAKEYSEQYIKERVMNRWMTLFKALNSSREN